MTNNGSPEALPENYKFKVVKGTDNKLYLSKPNKDKIFKWYKLKDLSETSSPIQYYKQFPEFNKGINKILYNPELILKKLNKISKMLLEFDIYLFNVGWKYVWNFDDYATLEAKDYIINKYQSKNYVDDRLILIHPEPIKNKERFLYSNYCKIFNFMYYSEYLVYKSTINGELKIRWVLDKKSRKIVSELFQKEFGNNFFKPANPKTPIIIKLNNK